MFTPATLHSMPEHPVGTRVYCEWENGQWYWGEITRFFRKPPSLVDFYDVDFYDGDQLKCVQKKKFFTETQYLCMGLRDYPPPPTKERIVKKRRGDTLLSNDRESNCPTQKKQKSPGSCDLYALEESKCGECAPCKLPVCGKCVSCRHNSKAGENRKKCCLWKVSIFCI